eukprot:2838165-Prymnesium_polylepis.1
MCASEWIVSLVAVWQEGSVTSFGVPIVHTARELIARLLHSRLPNSIESFAHQGDEHVQEKQDGDDDEGIH